MRKFLLALCLSPLFAGAQNTDVLFFNEGYYDAVAQEQIIAPSLGIYNDETENYTSMELFGDAQFLSDAVMTNDAIYVAADDQLMKLSREDYSVLESTEVTGIRDVAVYGDVVLASRGHYLFEPDFYFAIYSASDLELIESLPVDGVNGPAYATEDIIVEGDKAYFCVSNSFSFGNYQSIIGIYDLESEVYSQVDLGVNAVNPEKLFVRNGDLLAFCNHNYDKSSIAKMNINTLESEVAYVANNAGCSLSALIDDYIYYEEYSIGSLARFNLNTFEVQDTLETASFYSIAQHPVSGKIYGSQTDYVSSGTASVMNLQGVEENSFAIGVSAGNILFNVQETVGLEVSVAIMNAYPNPSSNGQFVIESDQIIESIRVFDVRGKEVKQLSAMGNRAELILSSGIFVALVSTANETTTIRLISE